MKNIIIIFLVGIIAVGSLMVYITRTDESVPQVGGFSTLKATVTSANSTVSNIDTLVVSPNNLQYIFADNIGGADIYCTFTATTTLSSGVAVGSGLRFDAGSATSTETSREVTQPILLAKYMHCIGAATSTLSILKY
jgi:hypothetical protein|tara:strand:- start:21295 stop:21705 length:411 start_codon:yes stop_codon:yes gene_type:complete